MVGNIPFAAVATYVYDQEWKEERERLAGIERLWDPGSRALVDRLGWSPAGAASRWARAEGRCRSGSPTGAAAWWRPT